MTTARDLIKGALRKINAIGKGASLDADEANDAFLLLNQLLALWSVEGGMVYAETFETFNLTAGDGTYTIGVGGDFNTIAPKRIVSAYVTNGSIDYPLYIIDSKQYSEIPFKADDGIPECLYYNNNYPLGTIKLYPLPIGDTLTINSEKAITSFTNLDTEFSMPAEYQMAIVYNLAVMIAPEYEMEASQTVNKLANRSRKSVFVSNTYNNKGVSDLDLPSEKSGNIYRGFYN